MHAFTEYLQSKADYESFMTDIELNDRLNKWELSDAAVSDIDQLLNQETKWDSNRIQTWKSLIATQQSNTTKLLNKMPPSGHVKIQKMKNRQTYYQFLLDHYFFEPNEYEIGSSDLLSRI